MGNRNGSLTYDEYYKLVEKSLLEVKDVESAREIMSENEDIIKEHYEVDLENYNNNEIGRSEFSSGCPDAVAFALSMF